MLQTFTRSIGDCPSNRAFTRHDVWNVVWNTSTSCPELRRTLESPSVSWRGVAFAKSANLKIAGAPLHNPGMFLYQLINGITWNHRGTLFISSSVQKKTFFLLYRGACMWTIHVFLVIMLCTDLYRYQNKCFSPRWYTFVCPQNKSQMK